MTFFESKHLNFGGCELIPDRTATIAADSSTNFDAFDAEVYIRPQFRRIVVIRPQMGFLADLRPHDDRDIQILSRIPDRRTARIYDRDC